LIVIVALWAAPPVAGQASPPVLAQAPDPCASPTPPAAAVAVLPADSERARLAPQVWLEWTKLVCGARDRNTLPREKAAGEAQGDFETRAKKEYDRLLDELDRQPVVQEYYQLLPNDHHRYLHGGTAGEVGTVIGRQRPRLARSVEAAATNPVSVGLLERSGVTDLVSLATQGTNLAANESADTEPGATAMFHALRKRCHVGSRYQDTGVLNRLGIGHLQGRIPEKPSPGCQACPMPTLVRRRSLGHQSPCRRRPIRERSTGRFCWVAWAPFTGLSVIADGVQSSPISAIAPSSAT
jgi:hypothetical protein